MRSTLIATALVLILSASLFAAAMPRGTVALGIGAASPSQIVVKIDGKSATVTLAGIAPGGKDAAQLFLQCLVAGRVLRVDRVAGRATMLDGTSVADHVAEFQQTRTSTDPCALGKAAYVPATPRATSAPAPAAAGAPAGQASRGGHVSFGSGPAMPAVGVTAGPSNPGPQRPKYTDTRPTYATAPSIQQMQPAGIMQPPQAQTYTPPAATTTTLPAGTTQPTLGTAQPYTPPTVGTQTVPTTSTSPPR